jgi:hypothetical protein
MRALVFPVVWAPFQLNLLLPAVVLVLNELDSDRDARLDDPFNLGHRDRMLVAGVDQSMETPRG